MIGIPANSTSCLMLMEGASEAMLEQPYAKRSPERPAAPGIPVIDLSHDENGGGFPSNHPFHCLTCDVASDGRGSCGC
jgi:hypothetical protein